MTAAIRNGIPTGKTRVIGVDLFSHEDYVVKDCDTKEEAFKLADAANKVRTGPMDEVQYVYDDKGNLLRDHSAVAHLTGKRGISP